MFGSNCSSHGSGDTLASLVESAALPFPVPLGPLVPSVRFVSFYAGSGFSSVGGFDIST